MSKYNVGIVARHASGNWGAWHARSDSGIDFESVLKALGYVEYSITEWKLYASDAVIAKAWLALYTEAMIEQDIATPGIDALRANAEKYELSAVDNGYAEYERFRGNWDICGSTLTLTADGARLWQRD